MDEGTAGAYADECVAGVRDDPQGGWSCCVGCTGFRGPWTAATCLPTGRVGQPKTAAEAARFGGTAGVAYDVCYHQACDTLANVTMAALDVNSDAIADSVARYAFNTTAIP